jgi:AcrR family transcriptional regulator
VVVKGPRPTHRQRQAQATRDQILTTARALFAEHGYVPTTIAAIAEAAGISAPTIYKAFGTKRRILDEVFRLWISTAGTQPLLRAALDHPDPGERLRLAAHWQRREFEIGLDVITIYQEAARADPEMAEEFRDVLRRRERGLAPLIDSIAGHLAPGITTRLALDRFIACTLAATYRTLVLDRHWTPQQYEDWLAALLVDQLLPRPAGGSSHEADRR